MKKTKILALIAIMAVTMNTVTGCGDIANVSLSIPMDEMVLDTEEIVEEIEVAEAEEVNEVEDDVEDEVIEDIVEDEDDDVEDDDVEDDVAEDEAAEDAEETAKVEVTNVTAPVSEKVTETASTSSETVDVESVYSEIIDMLNSDIANAIENAPVTVPVVTPAASTPEPAPVSTPEPAAPVGPSTPESAPAPTPAPVAPVVISTPEPAPVHTHDWKAHYAETQVWVPNIVTVEDYETRDVVVESLYLCNCGFETTDINVEIEHAKAHCLAGEITNYNVVYTTEKQQVLVGTHEEDQGHYETSSYIDYYYCDCGARQ